METNELRKLRRGDLLEILVEISEENDRLKKENAELQARLEEKVLIMNRAGSIAEASMQLNEVFETAQKAANQYLASIREINLMKKEELQKIRAMRSVKDESSE